jgi:nitroreductase
MHARRSVSPKRLCGPGPSRDDIDSMVDAALRAPDHGGLLPWRVVEFPRTKRALLADLYEDEKRRRDPLATAEDLARSREHATSPPALLAFIVRAAPNALVPLAEQWLGAGAALGSLLLAAHAMGFGAIVLSGERCQDKTLRAALGLRSHESLAGFISIGSIACAPRPARGRDRDLVLSIWSGDQLLETRAVA